MVGQLIFEQVEPEQAQLREDLALAGDALSPKKKIFFSRTTWRLGLIIYVEHNDVKCAQAVSGDKEQALAVHLVHIAHLSAREQLQVGAARLEQGRRD